MNRELLKNINNNETSKIMLNWLAGCNMISPTTNLITFKDFLKKKFKIDEQHFYKLFDDLEDVDAGYFSSAQPNVFHWEYNLTDVAEACLYPSKKVNIRKAEESMERKTRKKIVQPQITELKVKMSDLTQKAIAAPEPAKKEELEPTEERKVDMPEQKKRMGRPPGSKNRNSKAKNATPNENGVIFFFNTRRGTKIPFRLDDVADLITQAKEVESILESRP
jgi:hypothetical protein